MNNPATRTYIVGVIERTISYFKVEAESASEAAENWQDGEFWDRDDEALDAEGPCNIREEQSDGRRVMIPRSQWETAPPAVEGRHEEQRTTPVDGLPARFDDYEIGPCRRFREDGERDHFYYEPCPPDEADVWTLYGQISGQGVEAIGDFASCAVAEQVYARITGRRYGGNR